MKELSTLLSALSLFALLVCGLILLFPWRSNLKNDYDAASLSGQNLFRISAAELDQIRYEYPDKKFSLINHGNVFLLKNNNDETLALDKKVLSKLLVFLENFPAGPIVEDIKESPDLKIKLLPTAGEEIDLSIWQKNDCIYIGNGKTTEQFSHEQVDILLQKPSAYVDCRLTDSLYSSATLTVQHEFYPEILSLSYYIEKNNVYGSLISPIVAAIDEEQLSSIVSSLHALSADKAVVLYPTEEDLKTYGLAEPFCSLNLISEEENTAFHISRLSSDETVFLMKDGTPTIFQLSSKKLPWLFMSLETLTEKNIFRSNYDDCTTFSIQTEHDKYRFTKWDGLVLFGNREIDETDFKNLFKKASTLIPSSLNFYPVKEKSALLTLTFSYTNPEKNSDIIRFFAYNEDKLSLSINNESRFLVKKELAEDILTYCQRIIES